MTDQKKYRKTLIACYLSFITQAITANFAPLLFLKFHADYGISLGQIALIPTAFFLTQLLIDVFCARFVDAIGYRPCVVISEIACGLGLAGLAFIPDLFPDPFAGILVCVVIYAVGSGLIEVLASPIVEACPFEHKDAVMSLLHSFYCWGSVGVILLSTAFFALFGTDSWKIFGGRENVVCTKTAIERRCAREKICSALFQGKKRKIDICRWHSVFKTITGRFNFDATVKFVESGDVSFGSCHKKCGDSFALHFG